MKKEFLDYVEELTVAKARANWQGRAFGVDIWLDEETGKLYASRGSSEWRLVEG
jgi:hypothetical protein